MEDNLEEFKKAFEPDEKIVLKTTETNDLGVVQWEVGQEVVTTGKRVLPSIKITSDEKDAVFKFVSTWDQHLESKKEKEKSEFDKLPPMRTLLVCHINNGDRTFMERNKAVFNRLPSHYGMIIAQSVGESRIETIML